VLRAIVLRHANMQGKNRVAVLPEKMNAQTGADALSTRSRLSALASDYAKCVDASIEAA